MPGMSGGIAMYDMGICDLCGKEIPEGTGDEFIDRTTGEKFCLCDDCIAEGDCY